MRLITLQTTQAGHRQVDHDMQRSSSAMARRVDDDLVILDVDSGNYFGLNDVGDLIWNRLESDCSRDDLVDAVVETFDVTREAADRDITELVEQLIASGLVDP